MLFVFWRTLHILSKDRLARFLSCVKTCSFTVISHVEDICLSICLQFTILCVPVCFLDVVELTLNMKKSIFIK